MIHFWPRNDVFGIRLAAFAEYEPAENKIRGAKARGDPAGRLLAMKNFDAECAERRTKNKSEAERHADQAHARGALFRRRNVRDIGGSDGQIRAANAGENARGQNPKQTDGAAHAARDGEQRVGTRRAEIADEHDRAAADVIG